MKKYWNLSKKFPEENKKAKYSPMKQIWDYLEPQRKVWKKAAKFFKQ